MSKVKKGCNFSSVTKLEYLMPLQGAHMDSLLLQFDVGQILASGATEIGALEAYVGFMQ